MRSYWRQCAAEEDILTDIAAVEALSLIDLETTITTQAWSDDAFYRRLIADPRAAIEGEMGRRLPGGIRISVHQQQPDHLHIVLPERPTDDL